jgi:hypothetical protein
MQIRCTNCGADIPLQEESAFISCPFCRAALFVDTDQTIANFCMPPTIKKDDLTPLINRTLAAMEINPELELEGAVIVYHPFWRFESTGLKTKLIAAAEIGADDMTEISAVAGNPVAYDPAIIGDRREVEPTLLHDEAVAEWEMSSPAVTQSDLRVTMLYLPVYHTTYLCDGVRYSALIDGASGGVYADNWPPTEQREKNKVLGAIAAGAFVALVLESAFIPNFWLLMLAYGITAGATYTLSRGLLRRMGW